VMRADAIVTSSHDHSQEQRNHDMWFTTAIAEKTGSFPSPDSALSYFLGPRDELTSKLSALAVGAGNACLLLRGTPDPTGQDYEAYGFFSSGAIAAAGTLALDGLNNLVVYTPGWRNLKTRDKVVLALSEARQARFEHGETPR
jgi:hypothetical protein